MSFCIGSVGAEQVPTSENKKRGVRCTISNSSKLDMEHFFAGAGIVLLPKSGLLIKINVN